jgi:hypothetical protein
MERGRYTDSGPRTARPLGRNTLLIHYSIVYFYCDNLKLNPPFASKLGVRDYPTVWWRFLGNLFLAVGLACSIGGLS